MSIYHVYNLYFQVAISTCKHLVCQLTWMRKTGRFHNPTCPQPLLGPSHLQSLFNSCKRSSHIDARVKRLQEKVEGSEHFTPVWIGQYCFKDSDLLESMFIDFVFYQ